MTVSPFTVKGPDGVTRTLDEHYDSQKDVEQDPYGAWLAIQNLSAKVDQHRAELEAVWEAGIAACRQAGNTMGFDLFYQGWDEGCEKVEKLIRAKPIDEILKEARK